MPGTILVSVLEFMDLPLSSSTSISVSMGKIEYQISDKGNFSFPLTSLRDDLIVKIEDADGNEISRTGVHIRLILEKGVWEDIFPLGGGHLRLKLQFILNDEERDRIRIMRQSALKKKHDELFSSSRRGAESDSTTIIGNAALPFRANDEVSESPKKHLQHEAVSRLQSPIGFCDKESGTRNVVGAQPGQKQLNPNIADQYKETSSTKPVSQAVNLTQLQHKGNFVQSANQSPSVKHPQRVTGSEEMAILLRRSEQIDVETRDLIQPNLEEDALKYSEKKSPPGRTANNVRKMISAFESCLTQDMRSHIKPPPTKYQSSKIETKDSSKTQHLEQDKSWNTEPASFLQGRVKSASLVRDSQEAPVYTGESREQINLLNHISPKDTKQLKELSTKNIVNKQTDSNGRNKFKVALKTDTEEEKHNKDLMRTSTFETGVSGNIPDKHSYRNRPCKLLDSKQDSRSNPKKEEKRRGKASEGSYELCIEGDSPQKLDSVMHFDDKYYSFESSGVWIFPDESRKICISTSGKSVMGILGSEDTKRLSHQRSLDFSKLENVEKNAAYVETGTEGSKIIREIEESKTKSSDDNGDEISGGAINQVIKVAIILGFGILVLLTRQGKRRNPTEEECNICAPVLLAIGNVHVQFYYSNNSMDTTSL